MTRFEWFKLLLVWFGLSWLKITEFLCPTFLISKLFLRSSFSKFYCLHGFQIHFLLHHAMTWSCPRTYFYFDKEDKYLDVSCWDSVTAISTDIYIPPDSSTTLHTGNLCHYAPDSSRWVHRNAVICVMTKINTHFVTNFTNPKGEVPITVSPSINGSACLFSVNERFVQKCSTYC